MLSTIKLFRINLFVWLLKPLSRYSRKQRMRKFVDTIKPSAEMKVLDMGGQPYIWDHVQPKLHIVCLNLPGIVNENYASHHEIQYIQGDACDMPYYKRGDFDIIFSNSVIEHVGGKDKQRAFAQEVQRLSDTYWIQTPCKHFPIEAHCGMLFWWYYPEALRSYFLKRWSKKLPAWTEMVAGTTVLTEQDLKFYFSNGKILKEWLFFPKSLIVFSLKK